MAFRPYLPLRWRKTKDGRYRLGTSPEKGAVTVYPNNRWLAAILTTLASEDGFPAISTTQEAQKQALGAIRAEIGKIARVFNGTVIWNDPSRCDACNKYNTDMGCLFKGKTGHYHVCDDCKEILRDASFQQRDAFQEGRADEPYLDVDKVVAGIRAKRRAKKKQKRPDYGPGDY